MLHVHNSITAFQATTKLQTGLGKPHINHSKISVTLCPHWHRKCPFLWWKLPCPMQGWPVILRYALHTEQRGLSQVVQHVLDSVHNKGGCPSLIKGDLKQRVITSPVKWNAIKKIKKIKALTAVCGLVGSKLTSDSCKKSPLNLWLGLWNYKCIWPVWQMCKFHHE